MMLKGFLIPRGFDLESLSVFVKETREKIDARVELECCKIVWGKAIQEHDKSLMAEALLSRPWDNALWWFKQFRARHAAGESGLAMPLSLVANLVPVGQGRTLALLNGHDALVEEFARAACAAPHHFDPKSRRPSLDDPARGLWDMRISDWRSALGRDYSAEPSLAGVVANLSSPRYGDRWLPELAQAMELVGTLAEFAPSERAKAWVADRMGNGFDCDGQWVAANDAMAECEAWVAARGVDARVAPPWSVGARHGKGGASFARWEKVFERESLRWEKLMPKIDAERLAMEGRDIRKYGESLERAVSESRALERSSEADASQAKPADKKMKKTL